MNIKELLAEIRRINREIIRAERRSGNLAESALKATSTISAVRYGGTENHCKHEHSVLEQTEIDSDMADMRVELRVLRRKLEPHIQMMPPGTLRAMAKQRYMDGASCAAIARRMHYSRQHVYRLLDDAEAILASFERCDNA